MAKRTSSKIGWLVFAIGVLCFIAATQIIGQVFFINRTESMPRGIYLKQVKKAPELGDIVVFYFDELKGNLIKHVAAVGPNEFCMDGQAILSDGLPLGRINTDKYSSKIPDQSQCQRLKVDEILVIGDHPDSYDSRYFGPIKLEQVIAYVELVWEFKSEDNRKLLE